MKIFNKNRIKLFFFLTIFIIFYNEIYVFWKAYLNWPSLHKPSLFYYKNGSFIKNTNERPVRFLLVADPQLIGENDEPWFLSWLAQWDSDRYLKSTFILANSYTKPDATIFLGDLFDEGLKSSDAQVERYFKRFNKIFQIEKMQKKYSIPQIFISGDNDIGGEYFGDRNNRLVKRFEKYFNSTIDLIQFNSFIKFLKLDLDYTSSSYDGDKRNSILNMLNKNKNENIENLRDQFTIVLNHLSLLRTDRVQLNKLNKDSKASLIIKGDSHLFEIIKYNYVTQKIEEYIDYKKNPSNFYTMSLNSDKFDNGAESVYELSIPTCSYRMGVPNMGYGVLTISPNGKAYVSILWLPSRFDCIKNYIVFIGLILGYFLVNFCIKTAYRKLYFVISNRIVKHY
ncbi:unnamed protein product [Brachionus calyciflorus]|uniref:Calcineurin-like phosphoesterase domain-containing protein n=1 Tax=Brachionus calyciflorus TaxID=104777 RepID=A0A813RYI8_9BILA|nr:unnamed protein product [Brachionus calyciflorus]